MEKNTYSRPWPARIHSQLQNFGTKAWLLLLLLLYISLVQIRQQQQSFHPKMLGLAMNPQQANWSWPCHMHSSSPFYPIQNHTLRLLLNEHLITTNTECIFSIFFVAARTSISKAKQISVLWGLVKAQAAQTQKLHILKYAQLWCLRSSISRNPTPSSQKSFFLSFSQVRTFVTCQ